MNFTKLYPRFNITVSMPIDADRKSIPTLAPSGANNTTKISPSGSNTQSGAITASVVRIAVSANMNIEFGANPTATTTTSFYMPANTVEYFSYNSGDLVAAIGTGDVYITPVA